MEQSLHTAQHSHRVAAEAVIGGGGGGGDRKLAVGSEGVVGSSSAPSVCGIPPQAGDEGMSGVGGVVLSSGASAIGEITILRFLLLLVCTPVCGVPAAAASGREVDVACAALTPTTKDSGGAAAVTCCCC